MYVLGVDFNVHVEYKVTVAIVDFWDTIFLITVHLHLSQSSVMSCIICTSLTMHLIMLGCRCCLCAGAGGMYWTVWSRA